MDLGNLLKLISSLSLRIWDLLMNSFDKLSIKVLSNNIILTELPLLNLILWKRIWSRLRLHRIKKRKMLRNHTDKLYLVKVSFLFQNKNTKNIWNRYKSIRKDLAASHNLNSIQFLQQTLWVMAKISTQRMQEASPLSHQLKLKLH